MGLPTLGPSALEQGLGLPSLHAQLSGQLPCHTVGGPSPGSTTRRGPPFPSRDPALDTLCHFQRLPGCLTPPPRPLLQERTSSPGGWWGAPKSPPSQVLLVFPQLPLPPETYANPVAGLFFNVKCRRMNVRFRPSLSQ